MREVVLIFQTRTSCGNEVSSSGGGVRWRSSRCVCPLKDIIYGKVLTNLSNPLDLSC